MKTEGKRQKTENRRQKTEDGSHLLTPDHVKCGKLLTQPILIGSPTSVGAVSHPPSPLNAFTLTEVMVVMIIIMILMGITIGGAKYAQTKAATARAQAEIATMETALESFKNDNGVYPQITGTRDSGYGKHFGATEIANSASLYAALTTPKVYMTFKPNQIQKDPVSGIYYIADPFGSPYNYYCKPGAVDQVNQATFDLWSYGPAGTNEPPNSIVNDITNWKQN